MVRHTSYKAIARTLRSRKAARMAATGEPPAGPRASAASAACCAMLDAPDVVWLCTMAAAFAKSRGAARYPSRHPASAAPSPSNFFPHVLSLTSCLSGEQTQYITKMAAGPFDWMGGNLVVILSIQDCAKVTRTADSAWRTGV